MPLRLALHFVLALAVPPAARAAAASPSPSPTLRPASVTVAPARTSIYVGTVELTMPPFSRHSDSFESTYVAKVFPYFFYNESGTLRIDFSDALLARLHAGEAVDFTGLARRTDGAERRVAGRATPADARSGKLKVRVFYSTRIELIFNTTYRFPDPEG